MIGVGEIMGRTALVLIAGSLFLAFLCESTNEASAQGGTFKH